MSDKDRSIVAQVAYKCASWIHAAEVQTGAVPDAEHLFGLARSIANGIVKLGGSPIASDAGGGGGSAAPTSARAPSATGLLRRCPSCEEGLCTPTNRDGRFYSNKGKKKRGEMSEKAPDYACRQCGLRIWPDGSESQEEGAA